MDNQTSLGIVEECVLVFNDEPGKHLPTNPLQCFKLISYFTYEHYIYIYKKII